MRAPVLAHRRPAPADAGDALTIGALARAAGVGVETVRYYQRRGLLPQPAPVRGAYRRYPPDVAARLRFIRHAQQFGFTLDEISSLLQLADGTDRRSIRRIAAARLVQMRERVAALQRMMGALEQVLQACEHGAHAPRCPIIGSIEDLPPAAHELPSRTP